MFPSLIYTNINKNMSNDFAGVVKQHWANMIEDNLQKTLLATELCEMVDIPNGTTKNLPNVSFQASTDYTKYTAVTFKDAKTGTEQLVINVTPVVPFQIDDLDVEDNYISMAPELTRNASYMLKSRIDGDVLAEVLNAKWKYDNAGVGLNAGTLTPVALTTGASQNISTVFGMAKALLTNTGVNASNLCLVVDSFTLVALTTLGLETFGDKATEAYEKGFRGMFGGMKVYEASNLPSTVLDLATNPTAGDYIVVQGVTFPFVAAVGTTAGNVLIGASADATAQNLVAAVNGAAGAGTTYVEVGADARATLSGITATDGTDLVSFVSKRGALLASSSMTAAANDFRVQALNCAIMEKGAIKLSIRDSVKIKQQSKNGTLVEEYLVYARYGLKTTVRGAERMVRVLVSSISAEA